MNNISPTIWELLITEFTKSPLSTISVAIGLIALIIIKPITSLIKKLFSHNKKNSNIFKSVGLTAFKLNFLLISIPLNKTPSIRWMEKILPILFSALFLFSLYIFAPISLKILNTPANATLLFLKDQNESFYLSEKEVTQATIFNNPQWTFLINDCLLQKTEKSINPNNTIDKKICERLPPKIKKQYIERKIEYFKSQKIFALLFISIFEVLFLWLTACLWFNNHYSRKVREYILNEQVKAIHCAHGEFKPEGIYEIYQELKSKTLY